MDRDIDFAPTRSSEIPHSASRLVTRVLGALPVVCASVLMSVLVATRGLDVGTDTRVYAEFFRSLDHASVDSRVEPGFTFISHALRVVGFGVTGYQAGLCVLLLITVLVSTKVFFRHVGQASGYVTYLTAAFAMLLVSPSFVAAAINVIRQGLASLLVCAALFAFQGRRWAMLAATTLHYSSLLFMMCAPLLLLPRWTQHIFTVIAFLCYVSDASMLAVRNISPGLFATVMDYGASATYRTGTRVDFALFSVASYVVLRIAMRSVQRRARQEVVDATSVYLVLLIPFFAFGWGSFSDRYLLAAWLSTSLLMGAVLSLSRIPLLRDPLLLRFGVLFAAAIFYWRVTALSG
jgi:hypothetical protein